MNNPLRDGYPLMESPLSQLDRLLETWETLGQGERNILLVLAMRIKAGQKIHGKLSREKRDWSYEALEEVLDACVYMSCALEAKSGKAFDSAIGDAEKEVMNGACDDGDKEWLWGYTCPGGPGE